ncbi:bifunctional hydroxymethylpyrimidine kinase/phosphomethylpyrimidine kinase [Acidobacteria bacterium AH-259-G07]|nr:bifunctional hydroxymethylpyrimidine kinase/phosphomethylpyrimidine kinase [Acidobacteria bacterium AH-259-G07]
MVTFVPSIPRALTIAGSDSGGCAGIQADLKTFSALGVHGMSVITSVTAQDTQHVYMASDLPLENIERQIEAVVEDIGVDAVKTGMLSSAEIIGLVAEKAKQFAMGCLVVDPVMVTTGGDPLIRPDAVDVLKTKLFPQSLVVTPNLREAEFLTGRSITKQEELKEAMQEIIDLGPHSVIVKGGHFEDPKRSTDYFFDGEQFTSISGPRFETKNTHGSGCTFASAIAAYLAHGLDLKESIAQAKEYVSEAIRHSYPLGHGHGPLGHFWKYWKQ